MIRKVFMLTLVVLAGVAVVICLVRGPRTRSRTEPSSSTRNDTPSLSSDQAPRGSQTVPLTPEQWKFLADRIGGQPRLLIALEGAAAPRRKSGSSQPLQRAAFETLLPDNAGGEYLTDLRVRARVVEGGLHLVLHGWPVESAEALRPELFATLLLVGQDPARRLRVTVGTDGTRAAWRHTVEQGERMDDLPWRGEATWLGNGTWELEAVLSGRMLADRPVAHGDIFELAVRIDAEPTEILDTDAPAWWFYDAVRPAQVLIHSLDMRREDWPTVYGANGRIDGRGLAVQWETESVHVNPSHTTTMGIQWITHAHHAPLPLSAKLQVSIRGHADDATGRVESAASEPADGGFQRARLTVAAPASEGLCYLELFSDSAAFSSVEPRIPLWVVADWRQQARTYVVALREQLEGHMERPMWDRSIATAHVRKTLERIDEAEALTPDVLSTLNDLHRATAALAAERVPHLPTGFSRVSCTDRLGSLISFCIVVPGCYDPRVAWPFYRGQLGMPNMVGVGGMEANDLILARLEEILHLDSDRRYLIAWCGLAYDATDLLVQQPHRWAAAVLALRAKWSPLFGNAQHVPILMYNHDRPGKDTTVLRTALDGMRAKGCDVRYEVLPDYGHEPIPEVYWARTVRWLLGHRRVSPAQVDFATDGYWCTRNYWVTIDAIVEESRLASVSAEVRGDQVHVTTNGNVAGYTLDLNDAPVEPQGDAVRIIQDGRHVGEVRLGQGSGRFSRPAPGTAPPGPVKGPLMPGTIIDALKTRDLLVVWGAGGDDIPLNRVARWLALQWQAASPPFRVSRVVSDQEIGGSEAATDLVLIGSPASHVWMRDFRAALSIDWQDHTVQAGEAVGDLRSHVMLLLHPNPLAPDRYVLWVVSEEAKLLETFGRNLLDQLAAVSPYDWALGQPGKLDLVFEWDWADRFDYAWRPTQPGRPIVTLKQSHPEWQWRQWIAEQVRERTGADVFYSDALFHMPPELLTGSVSAWHLYRCLRNDWVFFADVQANWLRLELRNRLQRCHEMAVVFREELARWLPSSNEGTDSTPLAPSAGRFESLRLALPNESGYFRPVPAVAARGAMSWWGISIYQQEGPCFLSDVFVADSVVRLLEENPGYDLDAALSRQRRPLAEKRRDVLDLLEEGVP